MADVANIKINGTTYSVKDSVARNAMGGPNVAATKSAMTDKSKVYVYTGSESGMTKGNWYYWNGSAWTSGGVYQSTGFTTDTTLTVSGMAADAKATGDNVSDIKNTLLVQQSRIDLLNTDKLFFDLSTSPAQVGHVSSLAADAATNTLSSIEISDNRVVVGPFQLGNSVEIYPDSGYRYQLYKRFSTELTNRGFRNMSSETWQTGKTIEGANKYTETVCNYYMMLCYSDNRKITNETMYDLMNHIHIVYVDDNPLGFVEAEGMTNTAKPMGVGIYNTALRLVSYKLKFNHDAVFYSANPDVRSTAAKGKDIYNSASIGTLQYGCHKMSSEYEHVIMVQNYANAQAGTILLRDYSSFAELYAAFGINCDELIGDNKHITGNQLSDAYEIVTAKEYGDNLLTQIFTNGIALNDNGDIKFSHTPQILIHNGFAYVTFQCDRTASVEFSSTTEIELAKINLTDYSDVTYTTIAKQGTFSGITFSGRCSNPQPCISGDTIYIPFSGEVGGVQTLCLAVYDTTAGTYTIEICNFNLNGTSYVFNVTNFDRYIGGKYGIPSLDYEIIISPPVLSNDVYYSTVTSGAAAQMRTPIITTVDLINWSVYDVLPFEYGGDCECAVKARNGNLHIASRHSYADSTLRLFLYNIASKNISETIQIGATACRPTVFENDGTLAVSVPLTGRRTMQIMQFLDATISMGRLLTTLSSWMGFGYNSIVQSGDDLYFAIQTRRNGNTAEAHPHIWFGKGQAIRN